MRLPFTDSEAEYIVQKIGHDYIMDGDIVVGNDLPKTQSYIIQDINNPTGNLTHYKWPNCEIHYVLDASIYFNNMEKDVLDAIEEINDKMCLKLIPRKDHNDYIEFVARGSDVLGEGVSGNSKVGRQFGSQEIKLLIGYNNLKTTVMHEVLHAAGVYHEMSRPDRDEYIRIDEDNLSYGQRHWYNYATHSGGMATGPFDYCSIMLYWQWAWQKIKVKKYGNLLKMAKLYPFKIVEMVLPLMMVSLNFLI
jgi:hypothetical protein